MIRTKQAFTIIEIVVVIIIVGVVAALAWPRYTYLHKRMQSREAAQILLDVFGAQRRYKQYQGQYATTLSTLDIDVRPPAYFNNVYLGDGASSLSCSGTTNPKWVAGMDAKSGDYSMLVTTEGQVLCTPCNGVACRKMGYPANW